MPITRSFPLLFAIIVLAVAPSALGAPEPAAPTPAASWAAQLRGPVVARSAPRAGARVVNRVDSRTAFWRRPQRLLVLSGVVRDDAGAGWIRVRLTDRPNGSSGFIPVRAVRLSRSVIRVRVRIGARTVNLLRNGRRIASYPAAVGTSSTPTPVGLFAIQDPVPSSARQRSYLGPYILTLTAYSTVLTSFMGGNGLVAIHGTSSDASLGRAVSHGCIRVSNRAVSRLYGLVRPGTPVEIVR